MKNKTPKKRSAVSKLIPATCMLLVSATALVSSTYAWFTMSREVEVKNIQMTATVPEDLQISLGEIVDGSGTNSLGKSASYLSSNSNVVTAPADQNDADPYDWSNTADISHYYQFGKLIPASSTNGVAVYFTPDAKDVGKTLKDSAKTYTAVNGSTAGSGEGITFGTGGTAATAHANTAASGDNWFAGTNTGDPAVNYTTASAYNTTNDDGYYVDIPIWLRTSSTSAPNVYVVGYVTKNNSPTTATDDDLYQAVRVAVLTEGYAAAGGVLDLNDGSSYPTNQAAYAVSTNEGGIKTILDSGIANSNFTSLSDLNALNTGAGTVMAAATYGAVTVNKGATAIGTLQAKGTTDNSANATAQYGPAKKFIIRVWLEGDDQNCWNDNAGQDWSISLKFMTSQLPATA